MIYYMNHTGNSKPYWRLVPPSFEPRDADFKSLWFKIGDAVYVCWSDQFEKAVVWDKLKHA